MRRVPFQSPAVSPHLKFGQLPYRCGDAVSAAPRSSGCKSIVGADGRWRMHPSIIAKSCLRDAFCRSTCSRSRGFNHGNPQGQRRSRTGCGPVGRLCRERAHVEVSGTTSNASRRCCVSCHDNEVIDSMAMSDVESLPTSAGNRRRTSAPVSGSPANLSSRRGRDRGVTAAPSAPAPLGSHLVIGADLHLPFSSTVCPSPRQRMQT